jgi:hypothetical protein
MSSNTPYDLAAIRELLLAAFTAETLHRFLYDRPPWRPVVAHFGPGQGLDSMVDEVIIYCETHLLWAELLADVERDNPRQYERFAHRMRQAPLVPPAASEVAQPPPARGPSHSTRVFLSYKRHAEPDQRLAHVLHRFLVDQGHQVFIDSTLRAGVQWLEEIDRQIRASDLLVVLVSKASADSEMVQAEVRRAFDYRKLHGRPKTLPVRIAYKGMLPYSIDAFLDPVQYVAWHSHEDDERICQETLAALEGRLEDRERVQIAPLASGVVLSEDGQPVANDEAVHRPLPEFDPRFLEQLEAPGGAVKLRDKFYIRRQADSRLEREVAKSGTTSTIRAARQTGKSSLLVRGAHHARQRGAQIVRLDLQQVDGDRLASPDLFLRDLAELIVRKLHLDVEQVETMWTGVLGSQDKLTYLLEDYVLPETRRASAGGMVLALDEVDRLLQTHYYQDFFGLLRSWHNNRAFDELWDQFNLVMVISTEPYLLIPDMTQSPFNVGLRVYLEDFAETQVRDLNQRYGSPVEDGDISQLMDLLSGHPYLTRMALYTLATKQLSWGDLARIAPTDQGPFSDHLRRLHWLLRDEPDLCDALKQIVRHENNVDPISFFRLLRAGLVKGSGEVCKCRCDLYRIYFEDKLK